MFLTEQTGTRLFLKIAAYVLWRYMSCSATHKAKISLCFLLVPDIRSLLLSSATMRQTSLFPSVFETIEFPGPYIFFAFLSNNDPMLWRRNKLHALYLARRNQWDVLSKLFLAIWQSPSTTKCHPQNSFRGENSLEKALTIVSLFPAKAANRTNIWSFYNLM